MTCAEEVEPVSDEAREQALKRLEATCAGNTE